MDGLAGLAGDDTTEEDGLRFGVDEGALTTLREVDGLAALRDTADGALTTLAAAVLRGLGRPTSLCARGALVACGGDPAELGEVSCVRSITVGTLRGVLASLRCGILDGVPPRATMCRGGGGKCAGSVGFGAVRKIGGGNSDAGPGFGGGGGPCSGRLVRRSGMLGGSPMWWNAVPDGPALGVLFSLRRGSSGSDRRGSSGRTRWRESGCAN